MQRYYSLLGVILSLIICYRAFAQSSETPIRLYHSYLPFQSMLVSNDPEGLGAKVVLKILNEIDAPFTAQYVVNARLHRKVRDSDGPACALFQVKTAEREHHFYFSKPIAVGLNNQLYTVSGMLDIPSHQLNESGSIRSLVTLMEYFPTERLMIQDRVSYGEEIDHQIKQISEKQLMRTAANSTHTLDGKLLFRGRAKLAILSPSQAQIMSSSNDVNKLQAFTIAGIDEPLLAYVSCNMHPQSMDVIAKINRILDLMYPDPAFAQMHFDEYPQQHHSFIEAEIKKLSNTIN